MDGIPPCCTVASPEYSIAASVVVVMVVASSNLRSSPISAHVP